MTLTLYVAFVTLLLNSYADGKQLAATLTVNRGMIYISIIHETGSTRSVTVCPGELLTVTCTTNGSFIQWTAAPAGAAQGSGFNSIVYKTRDVSTPYISINGTDFVVARNSTSPLVSVVLIDNVTSSLNGATLNCTHSDGMTSTVINVIGNSKKNPQMITRVY